MRTRTAAFTAWLLLSLGLAFWPGCGIKTKPRAPEDVRPEQIIDLRANSVVDGIQLAWTRPERYQNGDRMRDLSEFIVLRGADSEPVTEVAKVPVTDQQRFQLQHHLFLVDKGTLMKHRYRYRVISRTSDGYESLPSNEAALVRTPSTEREHLTQHAPAATSQPGGASPAAAP